MPVHLNPEISIAGLLDGPYGVPVLKS